MLSTFEQLGPGLVNAAWCAPTKTAGSEEVTSKRDINFLLFFSKIRLITFKLIDDAPIVLCL